MRPSAVVDTNYTPLSSFKPNDGDVHLNSSSNLVRPPSRKRQKRNFSESKYAFLFRTGAFVVLEFGFVILAALAMGHPIPLNLPPDVTITEAKGGITIVSVVWHASAIIIVKDIIFSIFSAEWAAQYRRSGKMMPGDTDIVSRLTAGFVSQIQHFVSNKATFPYRLAFMSALLLMLVNGLGPSAITVNSIPTSHPLNIRVANLTITENLSTQGPILLAADRANLIVRLEQLENATYGFRTQGNVLIPWPASENILANGTIRYESDIVNYNFTCSWKQPTPGELLTRWKVDNKNWTAYTNPGTSVVIENFRDATILPMEEERISGGSADSPLIAFLFLGSNTTLSTLVALNLEGLPTTFITPPPPVDTGTASDPMLATTLLCDPQPRVSPATVTLSRGTLQALTRSGPPSINNVPQTAANAIFSQSLLDATSTRDAYGDQSLVNPIARILFLTDPSFSYDDKTDGIKPLSLSQINEKMNAVLPSAAKAYLSGYRPNDDNLTFPSFEMMSTSGTVDEETLALVGSKPFLVTLIVVVGLLVVLLIALVVMVRVDELQTFDLENIAKTLHVQ